MSSSYRPARTGGRATLNETVASPNQNNNEQNSGALIEAEEDQAKLRLIEISRRHLSEDSQAMLRMQRQQIDKLKRDNERLKEDLALETRQAKQVNNMSTSAQIAKLQDQSELYERKISKEREKIKHLNEQIENMNQHVLQQRKAMGGVNAFKQNNQAVQKQIRILENRLDKALVKFNEALAHNTQLRSQIENLRRERSVFDEIYKKLERELQDKKAKMEQIIQATQSAHDSRDQAQNEMLTLKQQADKDQELFEQEWAQLKQAIEQDRLGTANNTSSLSSTNGNSKALVAVDDNTGTLTSARQSEAAALVEARQLKEKVKKGTEDINKDMQSIREALERVQCYEEAFAKIQKATHITDIDELVNTFVTAEDVSFRMFNYVNDLVGEIETLEESVGKIDGEIEKIQKASADSQRKSMLSTLEEQLQETDHQAAKYENQYEHANNTMQRLRDGIHSIYHKLGCASIVAPELLGSTGVTETNMMQYLGIIEQRAGELINIYKSQQAHLNDNMNNDNDYNDALITMASQGSYQDNQNQDLDENGIDRNVMMQVSQRLAM